LESDLTIITEDLKQQKILDLRTCLILSSKLFCAQLFSSEHIQKLRKLKRAKQKVDEAIDIKQIMRSLHMTRILSKALLSSQGLRLAKLKTSTRILNDTESSSQTESDPASSLKKMLGW
jgi:hypothetical protein